MPWYSEFSSFLLHWAAESGLVLVAASAAVLLVRQPATRLRVIQWSFAACLLLAGLPHLDVGPRWSLSLLLPDRSRIRENSGADALPPSDLSQSPAQSHRSLSDRTLFRSSEGDNARSSIRENSEPDALPPPDFSRTRLRTDPRAIVVAGYLTGMAIMAAWWLAGWVAVRRLLQRSRPADERCHAVLREIAGCRAARVRLVECLSAAQPLVSGWWRPVIVVPSGLPGGDGLALRCALAHEWSHVAMPPIATFGKMGYAEEAVAALAEVLRSERATEDEKVAREAVSALANIGAPAAPVLIEGLADRRPQVRNSCALLVSELGEAGRAASDALFKLLDDKETHVGWAAAYSLVAVGDDDVLRPALERLSAGGGRHVLAGFLSALDRHPPKGDWWLEPCLRLANDEDRDVRMAVGRMLANHGPAEKRVIRAVEQLLRDDEEEVARSLVAALAQGDGNNIPLLVAVLSDAVKPAPSEPFSRVDEELLKPFINGEQLPFIFARLGSAPEHAAASVPLLVTLTEVPWYSSVSLLALDALGKLGPAAKGAIPALERWIARDDLVDDDGKKRRRRVLQKIRAEDTPRADQ